MQNNTNTILSIGGFTMTNKILTKKLGPAASILYGEIYSLALHWSKKGKLDKDGYFYLTYLRIFKETGIKEKTARTHLKKLEDIGLIETTTKKGNSCRFYRVTPFIKEYLASAMITEKEDELVQEQNTYTFPLLTEAPEKISGSIGNSIVDAPDFFTDNYQQNMPINNNNTHNTNLNNNTSNNKTLEKERESVNYTTILDSEIEEYILSLQDKFIAKGIPIDTIKNVFSEKQQTYNFEQQVIVLKHLLSYGSRITDPASFIQGAFDRIPVLTVRFHKEDNRKKYNVLQTNYKRQGKSKPPSYNWVTERK